MGAALRIGSVALALGCGGEVDGPGAPSDASVNDTSTSSDASNEEDTALSDTSIADASPTCGEVGLPCCGSTCSTGACCGSTCLDTSTDPSNCGICGHGCLTSTCSASMCVPTQVASSTDSPPLTLRNDTSNVYWVTSTSLYSCPKTGCGSTPTKLYGSMTSAQDLILDGSLTTTYVADYYSKSIFICPTAGCASAPTQLNAGTFDSLDMRSGDLFGARVSTGLVEPHQFHTDGTNDVDLGNGDECANDVVAPVGTSYVYWTSCKYGVRYATAGVANAAATFSAGGGRGIAADLSNVIWGAGSVNVRDLYSCPLGTSCASPVLLADKQLISQVNVGAFTSDGTNVYWTATDSIDTHVFVMSCAVTGCGNAPSTVASLVAPVPTLGGITFDKDYVYFAFTYSGKPTYVYRVAK